MLAPLSLSQLPIPAGGDGGCGKTNRHAGLLRVPCCVIAIIRFAVDLTDVELLAGTPLNARAATGNIVRNIEIVSRVDFMDLRHDLLDCSLEPKGLALKAVVASKGIVDDLWLAIPFRKLRVGRCSVGGSVCYSLL